MDFLAGANLSSMPGMGTGATGSDVTSGIFLFPLSLSLSSFSPPVPDERERGKRKEKDFRQS
jgi:hypothetical protein